MKRRSFFQAAAAGTAGIVLGRTAFSSAEGAKVIAIQDPFPGAVLNRRHGKEVPGGLEVIVRGEAPPGDRVTVNGSPARRDGRDFAVPVVLRDRQTDVTAVAETAAGRREDRVRVRWDRHSFPRYRFAIDDNSFFLRDVARKGYKSLFDCFYLKMLRGLHAKYGAKFVLNCYYRTDDGFELPQFPDRYKPEWRDNAGWLRLSFHALADKPDRPYQDAPVEKLTEDFDKVAAQIRRFAGEETYAPTTVIHWGMVRPEPQVFKALADREVRALSGYFERRDGKWDINYRLDDRRSEYLSRHDALVDFASGITFSKIDIVCNTVPLERIAPTLDPVVRDPNTAEIVDILTHEQYFWPFYVNYLPDHPQRLDAAIRFVTERGYKPVFLHEGFLGAPPGTTESTP
jgi:hypothetical protein